MLWEIASLLRRHSPAAWKHAAVDQLLNVYFLLSIHIMLMVVNDVTIKYFLDWGKGGCPRLVGSANLERSFLGCIDALFYSKAFVFIIFWDLHSCHTIFAPLPNEKKASAFCINLQTSDGCSGHLQFFKSHWISTKRFFVEHITKFLSELLDGIVES